MVFRLVKVVMMLRIDLHLVLELGSSGTRVRFREMTIRGTRYSGQRSTGPSSTVRVVGLVGRGVFILLVVGVGRSLAVSARVRFFADGLWSCERAGPRDGVRVDL